MRKTMFATASALALVLGTTALAEQATGTGANNQDPLATQQQTGAGAQAQDGTGAMPGAGEGRSYADLGDDERQGIQLGGGNGGFDADELMGASIVNADGDEIGTIEDLIVGEGDSVERVIVKAGGDGAAAGGEERHYAVELNQLERAEGDAADEFILSGAMGGQDPFMGMATQEKNDGHWSPSAL